MSSANRLYADQCSNIVTKKFYVSDGRPVLEDFRLKWRMLAPKMPDARFQEATLRVDQRHSSKRPRKSAFLASKLSTFYP